MKNRDVLIATIVMVVLCAIIIMDPHNWEPCPTEDSTNCYWDAQTQGNGEGQSFIAFNDDVIIYLP